MLPPARAFHRFAHAAAMCVVLLGETEAARVLASVPDVFGGELEVERRVLAGWTLDAAGTWRAPLPLSLNSIEALHRLLETTCST